MAATPHEQPRRSGANWAAIAGGLTLVYVVWYAVDLIVLDANPALFNANHVRAGSVGIRALFAVLFLAVVFHAADGLRRTATEVWPGLARRDAGLRAVVGFVTMAAWVPVAVVLLWPAVRTWFA